MEAQANLREILGDDDESTVLATKKLIDLYDAWGKPGKAAEWRAKLPDEVNSNEQDD